MTILFGADVPALLGRVETRIASGPLRHMKLELGFEGLPPELDGLRIGHVTDLHFDAAPRLLASLVEWAAAQTVDLWAVTGDLLETADGIGPTAELVAALNAPLGRWFVAGNNDNRVLPELGGVRGTLEPLGLRVLENEGLILEHRGARLALAGVDDPTRFRDDLPAATGGLTDEPFLLLLAHSPGIAFRDDPLPPNLVLSGHTHGGQICVPFLGPLIARTRQPGCGRRMAAGIFQRGSSVVYVSRGIGTSLLPIRILCPPEVTTVTLRSGRGAVPAED
jgi:hypothetical protein